MHIFPLHVLQDQLKAALRSEEHTSELQSRPHLVCRLLLEKKKKKTKHTTTEQNRSHDILWLSKLQPRKQYYNDQYHKEIHASQGCNNPTYNHEDNMVDKFS